MQRNVGNLVTHKDINVMTCLEYAVTALHVRHIIVCGHSNCGAMRASLTLPPTTAGLVNLWVSDIRDIRDRHADELREYLGDDRVDKLCELNVLHQVFNVCTSPVVQAAWASNQDLAVHGIVYAVGNGLLQEVCEPITCREDLEVYAAGKLGDNSMALSHKVLTRVDFDKVMLSPKAGHAVGSFPDLARIHSGVLDDDDDHANLITRVLSRSSFSAAAREETARAAKQEAERNAKQPPILRFRK